MHDDAPFRERPKFLLCPRCGELLEDAFASALACLRCEGMWLSSLPEDAEEARRAGPPGPRWRDGIECPECAVGGMASAMLGGTVGDLIYDRCSTHGLWIDRTELVRLMRSVAGGGAAATGAPELARLRAHLAAPEVEREQLARRRLAWRAPLDMRRKAALEYRAWLEAEARRRVDGAERTAQRLGEARASAATDVAKLESRIIMLREQLHAAEAELDGARLRLRAVDDQLVEANARAGRE